jgi:hypothetical protein
MPLAEENKRRAKKRDASFLLFLYFSYFTQAIDYNENRMTLAGLKKIRDAWNKTRVDNASNTIALGELTKKKSMGVGVRAC